MRTEIMDVEINHSDSIYIGSCNTCRDDVYSRSPQKYIVHAETRTGKPKIYCSEFCFDKMRERR